MVHYYLLDNGVLTNLPPERRSERSIVAVVSAIDHVPMRRTHMFETKTDEAMSQLRHKGKRVDLQEMTDLLRQCSFIENDVMNPVPICS